MAPAKGSGRAVKAAFRYLDKTLVRAFPRHVADVFVSYSNSI
jgi:hypothetical protein